MGGGTGEAAQVVCGNCKPWKEKNLSHSGKMHEFINREGGRWGQEVGTGGAAQSVRGNYTPFKGIDVTVLERRPQFITHIL